MSAAEPKQKQSYRIGDLSQLSGVSPDTLRYYEKIRLIPPVNRTPAGIRIYSERDVSRVRFIQRAQKMNFSLAEIGELLKMRDNPQKARKKVRQLTETKLVEIETHVNELATLRDELQLLLNLCRGSEEGCPIIENINDKETD